MALFGTYYTSNMLAHMKWPRKKGVLGKEVYEIFIVDQTINQMVDWAASIGSGMPRLAAELLAYNYRDRNWSSDDAPNIKLFADETSKSLHEKRLDLDHAAPHEALEPFQFAKHFKTNLPSNIFENEHTRSVLETAFITALLYGLSNPKHYENWYKNYLKEFENNRETYEKAGLGVSELPSLKESYANAKEIIDLYQAETGISFPPIPEELKQMIKKIRNE